METRPRILICDDEPLMTESLKKILGNHRYQIQTTNSSSHALTLIHADAPDLVILDIMMPGMTGFEVLDAVDQECCKTDFFIITGKSSVDNAIEALRRGACDFLKKPFEPDELLVRVEKILQQGKVNNEHSCMIDEKRQLEEKLRQSQKMEAIGTLAGGIAHDFNNILSIILGNTELALTESNKNNAIYHNLEQILEASLRARKMIQQLLNFSRMENSSIRPISLNKIIIESLKLMRSSLPTNIAIEKDICDQKCTVIADTTEMHQVIINLCTNAAHAMEQNGGTLTVRLESVFLKEPAASEFEGIVAGKYARLSIADTGHGIDKNIINKIFDPYFTTKEAGKGTGMGLSVVHGIVKGNGGAIRVFSRLGRFTEFHLYFPLVDISVAAKDKSNHTKRKKLPGGNEHILLVDDEEMLVDMMQKVLKQLGYTVTAHTNSTEAFKAFLDSPQSYNLLITDLNMPDMTGIGLSKAIKAERKDIPIILCTGFNNRINNEKIEKLGIEAFMIKPIAMDQLADTIRKVLSLSPTDRRKNPRFTVPPGTFIISHTHPYERCSLLNICLSGLAFSHQMSSTSTNQVDQLAIMTPDGEIFVNDLPCRTICDVAHGEKALYTEKNSVRRSVCFESLNHSQKERIENLIDLHTSKTIH